MVYILHSSTDRRWCYFPFKRLPFISGKVSTWFLEPAIVCLYAHLCDAVFLTIRVQVFNGYRGSQRHRFRLKSRVWHKWLHCTSWLGSGEHIVFLSSGDDVKVNSNDTGHWAWDP